MTLNSYDAKTKIQSYIEMGSFESSFYLKQRVGISSWNDISGRNLLDIYFTWTKLRASSYEPSNRAGSVTGTNFVVRSYGKFQPGLPG